MDKYREKYEEALKDEFERESVKHLINHIHKQNNLLRCFLSKSITVDEFKRWVKI